MELKLLALKTDLIFTKQDGEILDRGNYLVVKTTSNPNFFGETTLSLKKRRQQMIWMIG